MVQGRQIEEAQQQAKEAIQLFLQRKDLPPLFTEIVRQKVDEETKVDDPAILAGIVLVRALGTVWKPGSIPYEDAFHDVGDFIAQYFERSADEIRAGIQEEVKSGRKKGISFAPFSESDFS